MAAIFYDTSHRRKYYTRIGAILFIVLVALLLRYTWVVLNVPSPHATPLVHTATNTTATSTTDMRLVLTFDDGPDPRYTREILAILEDNQVPATFFLIGQRVAQYPDIVVDVFNAGYEIGNHSYTHSEYVQRSPERIRHELLATNKLIEQYTGHQTILYRPPYLLDLDTIDREVIDSNPTATTTPVLQTIIDLGFIIVGSHIDSDDWESHTATHIVYEVTASLPDGHIILFHDGGGDRSATVAALPDIITTLKQHGYQFVSLSEYLGLTRDDIMPATPNTSLIDHLDHVAVASTLISTSNIVPGFLIILLFLSIVRLLWLPALALIARRHATPHTWQHGVSIVIPAYNEEENIEATIKSVALSDYFPREIIIIDDGSTDQTANIVEQLQVSLDEDIVLITKTNGGKASALNAALPHMKYEVMVTIDADTVIDTSAVRHLVQHFTDPAVGAVAGKVVVVPRFNLLSAFQSFEYIVAQNIEKRGLHSLGAIGIVPGAIGAWRRRDVIEAGGYDTDTLVEDQDLTYAFHRLGKHVVYEPRAHAYTEVPTRTSTFFKQRFRWTFGTLQCLVKYRTAFFSLRRPTLGWIILPYNLIYMAIVPFLWPFILIIATLSIVAGNGIVVLASAVFFLCIDLLYGIVGLSTEPRKLYLIWCIPLQRLYYGLVFMFITIKCAVCILEGTRTHWIFLKRIGSARQYFEKHNHAATPHTSAH